MQMEAIYSFETLAFYLMRISHPRWLRACTVSPACSLLSHFALALIAGLYSQPCLLSLRTRADCEPVQSALPALSYLPLSLQSSSRSTSSTISDGVRLSTLQRTRTASWLMISVLLSDRSLPAFRNDLPPRSSTLNAGTSPLSPP
jgi:hypothetical protein